MATVLHEFLVKLGFVTDAASAKRFDDTIKSGVSQVKDFKLALVGMAIGVEEAIRRTLRSFDQLYFTSKLTGVPAKMLADLTYGLKGIGVDANRVVSGIAQALREPATKGIIEAMVGHVDNAGDAFLKLAHQYAQAIKQAGGENSNAALALKYTLSQIPGVNFDDIRAAALNEEILIKGMETRARVAKRFHLDDQKAAEQAQQAQAAWNEFNLIISTGIGKLIADNFGRIQKLFDGISAWMMNPTLIGALRGIGGALRDAFVGVAGVIWTELKEINWKGLWNELKIGIGELTTWIVGVFNSIPWKKVWGEFKSAAVAVFTWLKGQVTSINWRRVWEDFKSAAGGVFNWLGGIIRGIDWKATWEDFKSIAAASFDWLVEQVRSIDWSSLWTSYKSGMTSVIVWLRGELDKIDWRKVWNSFKSGASAAVIWLFNEIRSFDWKAWWEKAKSDGAAILTWFANGIREVDWAALWASFKSTAGSVLSWFWEQLVAVDWKGLWASFKSGASATAEWFWGEVTAIDWAAAWASFKVGASATADWFLEQFNSINWAGVWERLKAAAGSIGEWLATQIESVDWNRVGRSVGTLFGEAFNFQLRAITDIAAWLEGLDWSKAGRYIGNAIGSALTSIFSGEGGEGPGLQQRLLNAFFGVAKAAIKIGADLVWGIAQGIYESIPYLKTAVDTVVDLLGLPGRLHDKLVKTLAGPLAPLPIPELEGAPVRPPEPITFGGAFEKGGIVPSFQHGGVVPINAHAGEMVLPTNISLGLQRLFAKPTESYRPGVAEGGGIGAMLEEMRHWWAGDASFRPIVDFAADIYSKLEDMFLQVWDQALKGMGHEGGIFGKDGQGEGGKPTEGGGSSGGEGGVAKPENVPGIAKVLEEAGFTKEGVAGVLGWMQSESGFDPEAKNKSGHKGLMQWDKTRWDRYLKEFLPKQDDKNENSPINQVKYWLWEQENTAEKQFGVLEKLRKAKSVDEANAAAGLTERSGHKYQGLEAAKRFFSQGWDTVEKASYGGGAKRGDGAGAYGVPGATMNYGGTGAVGAPGENLTQIKTPSGRSVTVNKAASEAFQGFLKELEGTGYKIGDIGGYSKRKMRGGSAWSEHAFGTAIDINAAKNAMGGSRTDMPKNIKEMAAKYGLVWGGDWKGKSYDPMHFQWGGSKPWLGDVSKKAGAQRDAMSATPPLGSEGAGRGGGRRMASAGGGGEGGGGDGDGRNITSNHTVNINVYGTENPRDTAERVAEAQRNDTMWYMRNMRTVTA